MSATPVSKEEVRLLAIEIGVREAARRLGLNEDRVCQWSKRGNWFSTPKQINAKATLVSTVSKAGDILIDELADNERETRLSLSRYARRAAKDAEQASLKDAPYVKSAAQVAAITHKWGDQDKANTHFTLNVLNLNSLEVRQEPTSEAD